MIGNQYGWGPRRYQFRIEGDIDESARQTFAEMSIELADDNTLVTPPLADRAAVYEVIEHIQRSGLKLVGIMPVFKDSDM